MARPHPRAPRRARTGTPVGAVPAVVAALLVLAGCSAGGTGSASDESADGGAAAARSAVASGADCLAPQVLADLGFDPGASSGAAHPSVPDAVPVPAGFTAESAVLCSTGETLTDTSGTWAAVTATRLEGDVRPLVDALTAPATVPATGGSAPTCAPGAERTELWLVDALGAAVRVVVPGAGCAPLPEPLTTGLDALDAVDVEHYPVALVAPRPGASTGPTG